MRSLWGMLTRSCFGSCSAAPRPLLLSLLSTLPARYCLFMPRVDIVTPAWLKDRGYYLWLCRPYQKNGVAYDYRLVKAGFGEVICSPAGSRGMLAYCFPAHFYPGRARYPVPLHRLVAFNDPPINPGHQRRYRTDIVVHHEPHPRWRPWKNSRRSNMTLMTQAEHEEWHRRPENADVGR